MKIWMTSIGAAIFGAISAVGLMATAQQPKRPAAACDLTKVEIQLAELQRELSSRTDQKTELDAKALLRQMDDMSHILWDVDARSRTMESTLITMSQMRR